MELLTKDNLKGALFGRAKSISDKDRKSTQALIDIVWLILEDYLSDPDFSLLPDEMKPNAISNAMAHSGHALNIYLAGIISEIIALSNGDCYTCESEVCPMAEIYSRKDLG